MKRSTIAAWQAVHSWTSLLCTVFLLMLCLTGLPLIFHDEIDAALNPGAWAPANPGGEHLSLDEIVTIGLAGRPGEVPVFLSFDDDRPVVNLTTAPSADAPGSAMTMLSYDLTSGDLVPAGAVGEGVMHFLLQLHTDLFLGLPGMLFLGFMGLLFALSLISGAVLYWPFTRRLRFGTLRREQSRRVRWLDWHNLLGIAALGWLLVVGLTGVINTLAEPIIDTWRNTELAALTERYASGEAPARASSLAEAVAQAERTAPGMDLQFVAFPGSDWSTAFHYAIFLHGRTPLTEQLARPVLVSAVDGSLVGSREMPWYVKTLALAEPLHFGDYGGMPLKLVWALLDLFAIAILVTGVYLWVMRRRGINAQAGVGSAGTSRRLAPQTLYQVFRAPTLLLLLSGTGLGAALFVTGALDAWAALALASSIGAVAWASRYRSV
ncbi:PepSY-associated TM helix domain-containing protein [Pseudohaliea rubra]|uniref:Putative iron-regulated membrane protein n=1 Tax=Pseudohaliea rubra DSM 19751 TaxID=1265313 RepID=A0A095XSE2_9GAMM|nr:PepSY-associated TM helix domain-containing protein [Pseudohaliea rubra]KGE02566.1 putative iron-regulated membrane protein [Pseudohaliea rubra DSM 19751]